MTTVILVLGLIFFVVLSGMSAAFVAVKFWLLLNVGTKLGTDAALVGAAKSPQTRPGIAALMALRDAVTRQERPVRYRTKVAIYAARLVCSVAAFLALVAILVQVLVR